MVKFVNYKREPVDLIEYCLQKRVQYSNDLKVHIGTDSIAIGGNVIYFTVVAFRAGKTGVHFIFTKEKVPSYRTGDGKPDLFTRLYRECTLTLDVAHLLIDANVFTHNDIIIELDYNNLVETISTKVVKATRGTVTGYGYTCLAKYKENATKPDQWEDQIACKAANHLCQGVNI